MSKNNLLLDEVWGCKGILGQISPSVFSLPGEYFYEVVPKGVGLMVVTLGVNDPSSKEQVDKALSKVEEAAQELARGGPHFICLAGEPLILSRGPEFNKKIIKRIQEITSLPATTGLSATIDAFSTLHLKKLIVVSPSAPENNRRRKEFFEANGFEVINEKGPVIRSNSDKIKLPMRVPYNAAKDAYGETPEADGIYMPCGSWRAGPQLVELLEDETGKPVITSQQAFIWAGLKALNIREPVKGFGRLFETL